MQISDGSSGKAAAYRTATVRERVPYVFYSIQRGTRLLARGSEHHVDLRVTISSHEATLRLKVAEFEIFTPNLHDLRILYKQGNSLNGR